LAITRTQFLKISYYLSLGYFTYLMVLITLQYVPIDFDVAFLRIKQEEISKVHYQYSFFIHVYSSIIVLIIGIPQFSSYIRKKYALIHKNFGKIYIIIILIFTSPSGLIMAFYANGGPVSQIAFSLLSVLWFIFTYKAYQYAVQKKWHQHRNFMLRSFALTLSAISLRLFKWIIASSIALPPMDTYRIVAWAGWVVNLIIIEVYISRNN
jgi:uncharacterized membrane protein